jgi:hypothetical protein
MSFRTPPRIATWLLQHLGPSYRNDSLAGDLNEEFQLPRTRAWYWRQVIVAVWIGRMMGLGEIARRLRPLPLFATSALLRLATEAGAILGAIALGEQLRRACSLGQVPAMPSILTLSGTIGLCLSIGTYLSLCVSPALRGTPRARRSASARRLVGVFAATALSAGTLTWASSTSHRPQQCTSRANVPVIPNVAAIPSSSGPVEDPTREH